MIARLCSVWCIYILYTPRTCVYALSFSSRKGSMTALKGALRESTKGAKANIKE